MSQENVEIVRRAFEFEIYGRGDRAEAEEIFDPYFVMNPAEEGPPTASMRSARTSSIGGVHGPNSRSRPRS